MVKAAGTLTIAQFRKVVGSFERVYGYGATLLAAGLIAAALGNLGFQVLAADNLVQSDREALARLLGVLLICSAPFEAFFVVTARRSARSDGLLPRWEPSALAVSAVALGLGLLAIIALVVLDLGQRIGIVGLGLLAALIVIGAGVVPRGMLLGSARLVPVSVAIIVGMSTRLVITIVALWLGIGLIGVVVGLVVGEIAVTTLLWLAASHASKTVGDAHPPLGLFRCSVEPVVVFVALFALVLLPSFLAERYLGELAESQFVWAYETMRVLGFLPQAITVVAVASFARGGHRAVESLRVTLRIAAVTSLAVTAAVLLVGRSFPRSVSSVSSGADTAVVAMLGLGACALGLLGVIAVYHVARGLPCATTVVGALIAATVLASIWHSSLVVLSAIVVSVSMVALARLLAGPALVGPAVPSEGTNRRHGPEIEGKSLGVTVVVPFYNTGEGLLRTVKGLVEVLESSNMTFEVIAVSDGSTDGSELLVKDLGERVRTVVLANNRGKGAALCAGIEVARGQFVGFIDADGDIPPHLWRAFLVLAETYGADMIVGSKRHPLSDVSYPWVRRVYSRTFQLLVRFLFRVDVSDTQTGIKLFRRELLNDVVPLLVEDGFVFDLELLVVARRRNWRRVIEAPVRVEHQFRSTISIRSALSMLMQTIALAVRVYVTRRYDTQTVEVSAIADSDGSGVDSVTRL